MAYDAGLRKQLASQLRKSEAHAGFEKAVQDFPAAQRGVRPANLPHSAWELLEHLRLAQRDILEFSLSSDYREREWPGEYWPKSPAPANEAEWTRSVEAVLADREAFVALLTDPKRDLEVPFAWGDGQTLLREALLILDHNAYHVGEIVTVRQLLGIWK